MNISAANLKHSLKKLSQVQTETYQIESSGISARDSDVWVVSDMALDMGEPFNLNGKKFSQVVNRMSGTIEITREDRKITLKSAKAKVELEILPIKPVVFPKPVGDFMSFKLNDLKKSLSVASASASPNKNAAYGGVVQIQSLPLGIEEELSSGYRITGTDGHVLASVKVIEEKPKFSLLLNLKAAQIIQLMDGDSVSVGLSETIQIVGKGVTVYAANPAKTYPAFDSFISLQPKMRFEFDPADWLNALKTVEPLIDEAIDQGTVALHFKDGVVVFSNVGVGSTASDEAAYGQVEPDPVFEPLSFNTRLSAKCVSGFLSKAKNPAILGLVSSDKPVRFESENISVFTMAFKKKDIK